MAWSAWGNPCFTAWGIRNDSRPMKFATDRPRPYADPEKAARKLVEIANAVEAVQDGRIHIELINAPFLFEHKASPAEYKAGLESGDCSRLAGAARIRDLREIHAGGRGAVRLTVKGWKHQIWSCRLIFWGNFK